MKTRTSNKFGNPKDAVNYYKKNHMRNSAKYFLYKNKLMDRYIRFDVIEIYAPEGTATAHPEICHLEDAFQ